MLADRENGRVTHGAVSGPGQLLSKSDELSLVRYCQYMASHGHPLTKKQCFAFGTSIRRERDPNAQPLSRTWWRNFRQRHHVDLTMRTPEIIDRAGPAEKEENGAAGPEAASCCWSCQLLYSGQTKNHFWDRSQTSPLLWYPCSPQPP
ncbi:hypothetical protein SKAU_G00412370 [Synaphobranchus kaupii]|uniref:HTH CENPB-type domain-containing protein n=1 Tax=Synaphobranchus kaupii TaxID=118154 RepID=A0A9Q1E7Z7_SYNKA|nr:hypothetical protein SKAU_G00412370 [Synaphobranchus kaupii]